MRRLSLIGHKGKINWLEMGVVFLSILHNIAMVQSEIN